MRHSVQSAKSFELFGISQEENRFKLALQCASHSSTAVAHYFSNFGIGNSEWKMKIATRCVEHSDERTPHFIKNFELNQEQVYELATILARTSPRHLIPSIKHLNIKDQDRVYELALECAKYNGAETLKQLDNFDIDDRGTRFHIAIACARQNGAEIAELISEQTVDTLGFDSKQRSLLVRECLIENVSATGEYFPEEMDAVLSNSVQFRQLFAETLQNLNGDGAYLLVRQQLLTQQEHVTRE